MSKFSKNIEAEGRGAVPIGTEKVRRLHKPREERDEYTIFHVAMVVQNGTSR